MGSRYPWQIEVRHDGLKKYRIVRGSDKYVVEQMAAAQRAAWAEMWAKKQSVEHRAYYRETKKELARKQTAQAIAAVDAVRTLLAHTMKIDDRVNWDVLKDFSEFPKPRPPSPDPALWPDPPNRRSFKYTPQIGFLDHVISSRAMAKMMAAEQLYLTDFKRWQKTKSQIETLNAVRLAEHAKAVGEWEKEQAEFLSEQAERNAHIEARKQEYLTGTGDGVLDYCQLVLSLSSYPEVFPQQFELNYNPETKVLVVDYLLPSPEHFPAIKEI